MTRPITLPPAAAHAATAPASGTASPCSQEEIDALRVPLRVFLPRPQAAELTRRASLQKLSTAGFLRQILQAELERPQK